MKLDGKNRESLACYERLQGFEEKASFLLNHFWSTKYLTIRQMKSFISAVDSFDDILHRLDFFDNSYCNTLRALIKDQHFKELATITQTAKAYRWPNYPKSYEQWHSGCLKGHKEKKEGICSCLLQ